MGIEIERKFLLKDDSWRAGAKGTPYRQGYLGRAKGRTVRVRVVGARGFLTIKGPLAGAGRAEYEYEIPGLDAEEMLDRLCERPLIDKDRYEIPYEGHLFEVDEFHGDNEGLIVAEVELRDAAEDVALPPWIGEEVTGDPRYANSSLVGKPYKSW